MSNTIKGRFVQKHDIESNWKKATSFSPLQGEIIVYDPDDTYSYARLKIGDGATNVNDLPFASGVINLIGTTENPVDIDQIKSCGTYLVSGEVTTSMDITSNTTQAKLNKLFVDDLASGQFMSVYSLQEGFINQCVMSPVTPLVRLDSGTGYCDPFDVSKIQPVEKTSEMTQPVGMRRDGQLFTKPFTQTQSDWNQNDDKAIDYIKNKPTIPTQTSDLTNNSGFLTAHQDISGKLDTTGDGSNVTAAFTKATSRTNISTGEKLSVLFGKIAKWFNDLGTLAFKSSVAKTDLATDVQTSLGKADTALQSYTETDPTVPAWAKAETKPTYTAAEVGALPSTTTIPTKTSQLTNDSGFKTTDNNTTYSLSISGSTITLTGSDGSTSSVTLHLTMDSNGVIILS